MYAAAGGYDQAVEMLINVGANPELKSYYGETAYQMAKDLEYSDVLSILPSQYGPKNLSSYLTLNLSEKIN